MCFVVIFRVPRTARDRWRRMLNRGNLSVGGLEDLTLGRVVPEQLLDQVDVSEKHTAAAVAGESQFVERLTIEDYSQSLFTDSLREHRPHTLRSFPRHYRGQSI